MERKEMDKENKYKKYKHIIEYMRQGRTILKAMELYKELNKKNVSYPTAEKLYKEFVKEEKEKQKDDMTNPNNHWNW